MSDEQFRKEVSESLRGLYGETMALQLIVGGLCVGLAETGNKQLVENALSYADHFLEVGEIKHGTTLGKAHMTNAFAVIETIRKTALGDHGEPQRDV